MNSKPIKKIEVYNDVDFDYPKCGGSIIMQIADKPIYTVENESNVSGNFTGNTRQITLSRVANMTEIVYETQYGEKCTVADCLIPTEIGAYGRDFLKNINLEIIEEIETRKGHKIF